MGVSDADPTPRTIEQIELMVRGLREILVARIDALDRAIEVAHADYTRIPTELDKAISGLKALTDETFRTVNEKFHGIEMQFAERDVRVTESAKAQTTAVNAALQAAKEAVTEQNKSFTLSIDKSEKSTLEQIAQQRLLLSAIEKALSDKIGAIDSRVTRQESHALGASGAIANGRASGGFVASIVFGVFGAALALVAFLMTILRR